MKDALFPKQEILDDVLVALRRIVRSIDLHSKKLVQSHHLTIPQVVLLREIQRHKRLPLGDLAKLASLSNATVTGIIDRLESRNLVQRVRSKTDRRQVFVEITGEGLKAVRTMPPLLQESFVRQVQGLQKWEQAQILSSLQRVASIMNADKIEAEPILAHHFLTATEDDIHGGKNAPWRLKEERPAAAEASKTQPPRPRQLPKVELHVVRSLATLASTPGMKKLTRFLHESLKPYEDTPEDIERGIRDALSAGPREGGFLLVAGEGRRIAGALVMQRTGMKGYVPENLLLFVAVAPDQRGRGLGRLLVERAIREAEGNIKLHVEYDNPARRLYERIGFTSRYAEMRYTK